MISFVPVNMVAQLEKSRAAPTTQDKAFMIWGLEGLRTTNLQKTLIKKPN
jgi:hypothetical protein